MRQNYSTKSVCVVDFGLFIEVAITLTKYFDKVYYFFPWQATAFPQSNSKLVGFGIPGIEIVEFLWDIVDDVDLFVFTEVLMGDLQEELIRQGKRVFGCRRGEDLEIYREKSKKYFKKIGLPVGPYEVIKGLDKLRTYLKENDNQYVKVSLNRGDFETFECPNYRYAEPRINELEQKLGMKKFTKEFLVEAAITPAAETGYDGYSIDGQFPATALTGIETKAKSYLMKVVPYKSLPDEITSFNTAIAPALKTFQYRGFLSTEIRVTEDKTPYMIDFCARCGAPPMESMLEVIQNLPDIMWYGAEGLLVDIETPYKWAAELLLISAWADKNWQSLQFDEKIRNNVKMRNVAFLEGEYYCVPQAVGIPEIAAVVAVGQTMEEVIEECKELAGQVKGYFIEFHPDALDEAVGEIKKLEEYGIKF